MPVLDFSLARLAARLGKAVDPAAIAAAIPRMGAALESSEGDAWSVEVFPNRPDLLSVEGLARALRGYLGIEPGLARYEVAAGAMALQVDASVRAVRPAILCGVARGVPIDDEALLGLMGLQEDLHWGPGARRRKVSIGLHDLAAVRAPFTYRAADPDRVRFVPLQGEEELSMREMLAANDKGREYAHLVEPFDRWPLITDADGVVLSFPPIINGRATTLTTATRDVLIDVTGTDEAGCRGVLHIMATHLAEMGARLESVTVRSGRRRIVAPALSPTKRRLRPTYANRLLGTALSEGQMAEALMRMGMDAEPARGGLSVAVPAYRLDVLHEVDLVEDVAVGHGYDVLRPHLPAHVVFGEPLPSEVYWDRVRRVLVGLGFLEAMTLSLVGPALWAKAARTGAALPPRVAVQNAVSVDHDAVRSALLPSLLVLAERNVHRELPQAFFEIGDVLVRPAAADGRPVNGRRVAGLVVASDAGFTAIKRVVEAVLRELGCASREGPAEHPVFVPGRAAAVVVDGRAIGHYGEVDPGVITAFGVANPMAGFELALRDGPRDEVWAPPDEMRPAKH